MLKYFICFLILNLCPFKKVQCQRATVLDPVAELLSNNNYDSTLHYSIHKIEYDFNNDGLMDVAISDPDGWGNAGGIWYFYFKNKNEGYYYYDKIDVMHYSMYSVIKNNYKKNILIFYHSMGCCEGNVNYYSFENGNFKVIKLTHLEGESIYEKAEKVIAKGNKGRLSSASLQCLKQESSYCWFSSTKK